MKQDLSLSILNGAIFHSFDFKSKI